MLPLLVDKVMSYAAKETGLLALKSTPLGPTVMMPDDPPPVKDITAVDEPAAVVKLNPPLV